jgi:predicted dehydrogenase
MWQHLAHIIGQGPVVEVSAMAEYVDDAGVDYDKVCALSLRTEGGLVGRVLQDVVTRPSRKWGRVQGVSGYVEWQIGFRPDCDAVFHGQDSEPVRERMFPKTRADDFIAELVHIRSVLSGDIQESGITLERGLDTMRVLAACHVAARAGRTVRVNAAHDLAASVLGCR